MKTRLLASMLIALSFAACGDDDGDDGGGTSGTGTSGSGTSGTGTSGAGTGGTGGTGGAGTSGAGTNAAGTNGMTGDGDGADGERIVDVVASEFMFEPDTIACSPGETLIIRLRNAGQVDHSIEFELEDDEEVGLEDDVAPGDSADLRIEVPEASGDYVFYCPIDDHRQLGMEGTLTVE